MSEPGLERGTGPGEPERSRWEQITEWPLTAVALLFLAAYAWPILQPGLPPPARLACRIANWATWAVFVLDYLVRLTLADRPLRFVRRNLLDLAVIALPLLRPLRLLRLVSLLRVLNRHAATGLRGRVAVYVGGSTVLVVLCAALAELSAERGRPGATIDTFGDALWWAATTVTTVGYGDTYPVTLTGRIVAVVLMLTGIALIGVVTAGLASWLVQQVQRPDGTGADRPATSAEVASLRAEVAELRSVIMKDRGA